MDISTGLPLETAEELVTDAVSFRLRPSFIRDKSLVERAKPNFEDNTRFQKIVREQLDGCLMHERDSGLIVRFQRLVAVC